MYLVVNWLKYAKLLVWSFNDTLHLLELKNMHLWQRLLSAFDPSLLSERFRAVGCKLLSSAIQLWEQQLAELFVALHSLN